MVFATVWSCRFSIRQHLGEPAELRLDGAEHFPDLGGTLLDRQRAESHLRAVEVSEQVRRAADRHPPLPLNMIEESGPAKDLGEKPLERQVEQREIGRMGRLDVLLGNGPRFELDPRFERLSCQFRRQQVARFLRGLEPLVVLLGKLRVDRQQDRGVTTAGQLDRELHALARARAGSLRSSRIAQRHHLLEERRELRLAKNAARLHVGQHALEVAHPAASVCISPRPLCTSSRPIGNLLERFGQALLERGVQFLVHGLAHLLELGGVVTAESAPSC